MYTPFQRIHGSSKAPHVHVHTYREQSTCKLLGLVPPCSREFAYPNKLGLATGLNLFTTSWLKLHFPHAIFHQLLFMTFFSVLTRERYGATLKALCQKTKATAKATAATGCPMARVPLLRSRAGQHPDLLCLRNALPRQDRNTHGTHYPFRVAKYVTVGP